MTTQHPYDKQKEYVESLDKVRYNKLQEEKSAALPQHTEAEEIAKRVLLSLRRFKVGQYPEGSDELKAFEDGYETACGMVYIDLVGTPKSKGILEVELTKAKEKCKKQTGQYYHISKVEELVSEAKEEERERIKKEVNTIRRDDIKKTEHGYVFKSKDTEKVCNRILEALTPKE